MASNQNHTTTLTATKEQLVNYLDNVIYLVRDIYELLNNCPDNSTALNDMKVSMERLDQNRQNVINLELRMCVVASMKAGKSTIINAILGQNILPSRNAAMTVLPTEVVLCVTKTKDEIRRPILSLHRTLIDQLTSLQRDIRNHLHSSNTTSEQLLQHLPNHPHLVGLAKEILDDIIEFHETNESVESINHVLERVNDVIRLHEYLIPTKALDSTKRLCFKLPRIYAPYVGIGNETVINESLGNLVIVDTPGPNEDTTTPFLKEIIQQELDKSFVILVVLDFNQFNTEADKAIKLEITKIREANYKSSESLFALVNKVDQRRKRDMTKDQVQQLIKKMFSIDEQSSGSGYDRIFEVQAFRALMSKQFFIELSTVSQDDEDCFDISALPSSQDFLNEAYGTAYNDDSPPTKDKAMQDAQAMWRRSGFEAFLNGVIEKLIEKAAPHLLEQALVRCHKNVYSLHENLLIREQLLDADEQKLRAQMVALQGDCEKLTHIMDEQIQELRKEQESMKKLFTEYFQEVEQNSQQQMQSELERVQSRVREQQEQQQEERTQTANTVQAFTSALATLLAQNARTAIAGAVLQLGLAFKKFLTTSPTMERITFDNEDSAKRFLSEIEANVRGIPEAALVSLRKHVDEQCGHFCSRLNNHLQNNTNAILIMTRERLANELKIEFPKPPMLDLKFSDEKATDAQVKLEKTYSPWWLLRLVSISYEMGEKEGTSYHISRTSLKTHCKRLLTASMKSIEENLQKFIDGELQQTFDSHFQKLQDNLKRYQNYVTQSLTDQKRTTEDKVEFKKQLNKQREHINDYAKTLTTISNDFYNRMNSNQKVSSSS